MNTFQLNCFLAVADTLSFARAAEIMNITQPSITYQIQTLENELNVKLFHRTTRRVEITLAGETLLDDAREMSMILGRIKRRYTGHYLDAVPFSIGCHGHSQLLSFPVLLQKLVEQYPTLRPDIRIVPYKHLYRLLEEGSIDVVMTFRGKDIGKAPGVYKELASFPIAAVCPANHPTASGRNHSWKEFKSDNLILCRPEKCPPTIAELQNRLLEQYTRDKLYFCDSPEIAVDFVRAGLGTTFLPLSLVPDSPSVISIPLRDVKELSFGLYYKTLKDNPILKDFVHIAQEYFEHTV